MADQDNLLYIERNPHLHPHSHKIATLDFRICAAVIALIEDHQAAALFMAARLSLVVLISPKK